MNKPNQIVFLGTGGARVVVSKQIRASGGIWFSLDGTEFLVDPGPGSLLRCLEKGLKPSNLKAIVLSHRHLDHAADVNVMIEAMTEGGFARKGTVFAPRDVYEDDPVVLRYVREYLERVEVIEVGREYKIGRVTFECPVKHIHGNTETYGFNFRTSKGVISYIADTRYFPDLAKYYTGQIMIINVLRPSPSNLDHLCINDVERILEKRKPEVAILTHFGMALLRANPWKQARSLEGSTGVKVVIAKDGMVFDVDKMDVVS